MFKRIIDSIKGLWGRSTIHFRVEFDDGDLYKGTSTYVGDIDAESVEDIRHAIKQRIQHRYPMRRMRTVMLTEIVRDR